MGRTVLPSGAGEGRGEDGRGTGGKSRAQGELRHTLKSSWSRAGHLEEIAKAAGFRGNTEPGPLQKLELKGRG